MLRFYFLQILLEFNFILPASMSNLEDRYRELIGVLDTLLCGQESDSDMVGT